MRRWLRTGGKPQYSSFDGKGNERVVVLGENEKSQPSLGTGPDATSAQTDAETGDSQIGDFGSEVSNSRRSGT